MNQYLKRLKIILQCNRVYYFLLLVWFVYIVIYFKGYECDHLYDINKKEFLFKINDYKITKQIGNIFELENKRTKEIR